VGKTLLHGDVLMWLMKTLLTSGCTNQRGAGQIFKWNETQIPVSNVLALTDEKPIIWQRTGKADKTHWVIFVKGGK
ncbi:hypothetical protein SPM43_19690, partial [Enterobacter chengduensis]